MMTSLDGMIASFELECHKFHEGLTTSLGPEI